ncbi:helix-turn-helix domain-containing protein [Mycolicibacterium baixiangningiae]|uniref:helix-turn-helix domain-containing protein n=1 Tax=Mycolicibacterium baixiangningiae TaxID=2761578 RepID=UPI00299F850D|nr:helix-turn-helix transcriptional regulator [Mycolicibacterium baixiangningiae]
MPADGRVRRVPGLRRDEVALLAGASTDYFTRLEQGRPIIPSGGALAAIAKALGLDATGRAHLGHLTGAPLMRTRPRGQRDHVCTCGGTCLGQRGLPNLVGRASGVSAHPWNE